MFKLLFPPYWTTVRKLIWLKATTLAVEVWKTVSGAIVSFLAVAAPLRSLTIAIEPVQDLHGYDYPWPAGGGKNLFNATARPTRLTFADGVYTLNEAPSTNVNIGLGTVYLEEGKSYILSGGYSVAFRLYLVNGSGYPTSNSGDSSVFTPANGSGNYSVYTVIETTATVGTQIKPMVRLSSQPSGFATYSNICPITGWTGANVTRTGKNLFDKTTAVFVAGGFSSGVIASYSNHYNTYLPCKPNTTYTLSRKRTVENERFAVAWCADTPDVGVAIFGAKSITNYGENIGETLSLTITTGATAKYLAIWAYWTATDITEAKNTLQVQVGSSVSSYEAYTGTTIPISFPTPPGTVYGGTLDVTTGVLTVTMASVDMGTLTWSAAGDRKSVV